MMLRAVTKRYVLLICSKLSAWQLCFPAEFDLHLVPTLRRFEQEIPIFEWNSTTIESLLLLQDNRLLDNAEYLSFYYNLYTISQNMRVTTRTQSDWLLSQSAWSS